MQQSKDKYYHEAQISMKEAAQYREDVGYLTEETAKLLDELRDSNDQKNKLEKELH